MDKANFDFLLDRVQPLIIHGKNHVRPISSLERLADNSYSHLMALEDPLESLGYEIAILLQFPFFGLIGKLIFAIITWISYVDVCQDIHLGFASFIIYFVMWVTSCEEDWETMGGRLGSGSEEGQAVRITVDLVVTLVTWDYLGTKDIFWGEDGCPIGHDRFGGPLISSLVHLVGSYMGCVAYLALFRLVTNMGVGVRMVTAKIWETRPQEPSSEVGTEGQA